MCATTHMTIYWVMGQFEECLTQRRKVATKDAKKSDVLFAVFASLRET